ncbi:uncharacterized protein BDZ83DRAFT_634500 [Colletotrichum acutatum]|uniref:Secreted protein n=1 Tax=Glomerella acutata TaxID=27357 RepID=A0AAD8UCT0_GLOAC|nr:uncharacterized protein BDZ83DRAFT_634500 [Colletotrichum acutatum]KAK1716717.1 hypothetical protein BDZ83DRAFT_634500 [Colletotrichum acutatum]
MKLTAVLLSASALFLGSANAWWCTNYGKQANHLSCKALYPVGWAHCTLCDWRGDCMLTEDTPCGEGGFEGCVSDSNILGNDRRRTLTLRLSVCKESALMNFWEIFGHCMRDFQGSFRGLNYRTPHFNDNWFRVKTFIGLG